MIHHGDCLDVMAGMEPESVDAIVTDPPYGLEFMGKEWDRLGGVDRRQPGDPTWHPSEGNQAHNRMKVRYGYGNRAIGAAMQEWHARWAEAAYRVAKPSAYLLAFGGTRTVHRMTVALEDAGWIIRDMLVWAYASGFPKSKASLKPAWEPIVMARKPGPLRMLAIDECRIPTDDTYSYPNGPQGTHFTGPTGKRFEPVESSPLGRWPANVILTDPIFDGGVEGVVGGGEAGGGYGRNGSAAAAAAGETYESATSRSGTAGYNYRATGEVVGYGDSGTYSRFFLIPKADRSDREPVLTPEGHDRSKRFSTHPTVKPTDLMRHLVRLVTPTGGTVLDPFLGSGTTGIAAEMEGFAWIGIEREAEYVAIAEARLNGTQRGLGLETA